MLKIWATTKPGAEVRLVKNRIGPWLLLALLSLTFLLDYVDRQVVFDIFPLLRRDLGFSVTQLGLAGSLFTWTYSLMMPIAGRLADLVPRQRLIVMALVVWSMATLGSGCSGSATQFLWWRVAMGISESLYVPAAVSMIATAHPGPTRSRAFSIHGLAQFAGISLGGWYGGWSAEHFGWRVGFAALSSVGILYSAILAWQLRGFDRGSDREGRDKSKGDPGSNRASVGALLRSRCYALLCVAFLAFCGMLWMLYAWLPDYLFRSFHLSLSESGVVATLYLQVSSAAGILVGGVVGDRFGRTHPRGRLTIVVVGLIFSAPCGWGIFTAGSLWALKFCTCAFGLFAGLVIANVFSALYDVVAPANFGLATGLLNLFGGIGGGTAILLAGMLQPAWSASRLMLMGAGASIISGGLLGFVAWRSFEGDRKRAGSLLPGS